MVTNKNIEKVLARTQDIPALSTSVMEVLHAIDDPAVDMPRLSSLIERDPGLAAKILRVSNSPYYGMKQHVGSLGLALVLLGVREVRNIVLGVAVLDVYREQDGHAEFIQGLWDHSAEVGALARQLSQRLCLALFGEDFIAGLLHDIGKVVMLRAFGAKYVQFCEASAESPAELVAIEEQLFGFSHTDAAAALARKWNLPQTLADAICLHHQDGFAKAKDPMLAALVCVADSAVREDLSLGEDASCATCAMEDAWAVLAKASRPIPPDERYHTLCTLKEELAEFPPLVF